MWTPRCTTLSVRPRYFCWWHFGNRRWTRTLPPGPPRFNEQENGSLRPSPLVPTMLLTWPTNYPLTCLAYMIVQDVIALPTFNPHGGPITHSSTGSKPDSPIHPLFPRMFLARGLVYNSRATSREIINSGIRHKTYSHCSGPLLHFVSGIERLPTRLKLLMVPSYFALDIFLKFQFESYFPPPSPMLATR